LLFFLLSEIKYLKFVKKIKNKKKTINIKNHNLIIDANFKIIKNIFKNDLVKRTVCIHIFYPLYSMIMITYLTISLIDLNFKNSVNQIKHEKIIFY
jgi:hypothetical protein